MQMSNMLAILQVTSVNCGLASAVTLVINTGKIDLSVGTMMTFCAVITDVMLTYAGMRLIFGVIAAVHWTLDMIRILKGLSLVSAGTRLICFNDIPGIQ